MANLEGLKQQLTDDQALRESSAGTILLRSILEDQESKYKHLVQNIQEYIYSVRYVEGSFTSTYHSAKSLAVTGYTPEEYERNPVLWFAMIYEEDRPLVNQFLNNVIMNHQTGTIEHRIIHKDGRIRWVSNTCSAVIDRSGTLTHLNGFILDVTTRKRAESLMQLAIDVLNVLNTGDGMRVILQEIVTLVKKALDIEAVAIRLHEGGDYTYSVHQGFPEYFIQAENSLLRADSRGTAAARDLKQARFDCLCGMVVEGKRPTDSPYFTENGSFWINAISELRTSLKIGAENAHLRNRCMSEGYESVALIPLRSHAATIGIFQMNDHRRGMFDRDTIVYLEGLGASIGVALMRKIAEEAIIISQETLRQRNEAMEKDLRLAQAVQSRFFKNVPALTGRIKIAHRYLPHDAVGGDYFSITPLQEGGVGIFIGDVVGHGISAALFLSLLKAACDRVCRLHGKQPAEYLKALNHELIDYMDFNFITAIYGYLQCLDQDGACRFVFANGGHPWPLYYRKDGEEFEFLNAAGTILGAYPDLEFEERSIALSPGDRLFLYTDGIPESMNREGSIFGFDELRNAVARAHRPSLDDTLDGILNEVNRHKGGRSYVDDIIIIGIEIV